MSKPAPLSRTYQAFCSGSHPNRISARATLEENFTALLMRFSSAMRVSRGSAYAFNPASMSKERLRSRFCSCRSEATDSANIVSADVVDGGCEVFLKSEAESIDCAERCSQIVRNGVAEGLELPVDA